MVLPYATRSDFPFMYEGVRGLVSAVREFNGPQWLSVLEDHFPKVFRGSSLAVATRLRALPAHQQSFLSQYVAINFEPSGAYEKVI